MLLSRKYALPNPKRVKVTNCARGAIPVERQIPRICTYIQEGYHSTIKVIGQAFSLYSSTAVKAGYLMSQIKSWTLTGCDGRRVTPHLVGNVPWYVRSEKRHGPLHNHRELELSTISRNIVVGDGEQGKKMIGSCHIDSSHDTV
jgi:hypothetical protein